MIAESLRARLQAQRGALVPPPRYDHLLAMSDQLGLFEHARYDAPRRDHGYCVDDVARGLLVAVREPNPARELEHLTETYLRFIENAIDPDGSCHNRRNVAGEWTDEPALGDWWGRALWGLGVAAAQAPRALTRKRALRACFVLAQRRSPSPRAMVFAALGIGQVVLSGNDDARLTALLRDAVAMIPAAPAPAPAPAQAQAQAVAQAVAPSSGWAWPEPGLRYGNGSVAEALLVAGAALNDTGLIERGLAALTFLVETETRDEHFSVTGTGGRTVDDLGPQFDQQPIELAAIADAAARAFDVTGEPHWARTVQLAWEWFIGNNDSAVTMIDIDTGAGYDGLTATGRNENRGAESTLAALATQQVARRFELAAAR